MNYQNYFNGLTDDEIIKKIEFLKKQNKNSNEWKKIIIIFVTNCFDLENKAYEIRFYNGRYQPIFMKMKVSLNELIQYINDIKDEEIYQEAKSYIDYVLPIIRGDEIKFLETRLNSGIMSRDEENHHKMNKVNKILTKAIITVIIAAAIYVVLVMLFNVFGYSFR